MTKRIIFLGTGGGMVTTFSQIRKTGGIYIELDGKRFVIDPGPGSLVHAQNLKLEPEKWNGILVSHGHVDHYSDASILLNGMKDPFIVAEEHCLQRTKDSEDYPCINKYHQNLAKYIYRVKAGDTVKMDNISIRTTFADHYSPTVGFIINSPVKIGYTSDGNYYPGQEKAFDGCDILILNTMLPKGELSEKKRHMNVDDAIRILRNMANKPKLAILTHFSLPMIRSNLYKQVKIVQDSTGVRTIFAEDFMEIDLDMFDKNLNAAIKILK